MTKSLSSPKVPSASRELVPDENKENIMDIHDSTWLALKMADEAVEKGALGSHTIFDRRVIPAKEEPMGFDSVLWDQFPQIVREDLKNGFSTRWEKKQVVVHALTMNNRFPEVTFYCQLFRIGTVMSWQPLNIRVTKYSNPDNVLFRGEYQPKITRTTELVRVA